MIKIHLATNNIFVKSTKDNPIVVGSYTQWLVSNSGRKEGMDANIMPFKLKYKVYKISSLSVSSYKIINESKIYVASAERSDNTDTSKIGFFSKE